MKRKTKKTPASRNRFIRERWQQLEVQRKAIRSGYAFASDPFTADTLDLFDTLADDGLFDFQADKYLQAIQPSSRRRKKPKRSQAQARFPDAMPGVQVFDIAVLRKRQADLEPTEKSMKSILKKFDLEADTGIRLLKPIPDNFMVALQGLKEQYPNCLEFLDFLEHFAALSQVRAEGRHMRFPPVLLAGPPGVGKTAVVRAVAQLLGVQCRIMDMASATASFVLAGMSSAWAEAKTGCVIDLLRDGDSAHPILVMDEIDKVSQTSKYDPLGALYTLLEREASERFVDEALDVPSNASHVLYVATANELDRISAPLLSRFVVLTINSIDGQHRRAVCHSVYRSVLAQEGVADSFDSQLSEAVQAALDDYSPRQIKQILIRAVASAARRPQARKRRMIDTDDLVKPASEATGQPMGFVW